MQKENQLENSQKEINYIILYQNNEKKKRKKRIIFQTFSFSL
jgi:hypothetical protein